MYAVIFTAEINELDDAYYKAAERMRNLAINKYGCTEFNSVTEGDKEVAISCWKNQQQIIDWKQNEEHLETQELGKKKWYKNYKVQIVEILREYSSN